MNQHTDIRIVNAVVEFLDKEIDPSSWNILAECLEMIDNDFEEPLLPTNKKGIRENGNIRENKK